MIKGDLYCKACFLKVFKEKGSYASFGVKTLPNWKPGQEADATGGTGASASATPSTTAPATSTTSDSEAKSDTGSSVAVGTTHTQAPAASGVNLSSSELINPKCKVCLKTVYDQEKQVYDKTVWHIACFKCLSCKRRIDVKAVAMIQGDLYCKVCFLRVFKEKGSYASFGPKTLPKWEGEKHGSEPSTPEPSTPDTTEAMASEPTSAPATEVPVATEAS
jgi:hypothetical protein